ncbi:uncharacterized protein LOC126563188 [Anopheles maculipalpis]|uniref:uncharacterized protein LOC126563188 n=1 Tax=Anopheles maculipalpis TaxID=1496333 RepID=UPI0021590395|nr:uncharacterized protein LOC126563188 [Anopheles maculipalpis]
MDIIIDKFLNETGDSYRLEYYPTELMLYFEKHHIFEIIFDLMIMLQRERPPNVEEYMAKHIVAISKKYYQINTYVNFPENVDAESFVRKFQPSDHYYPIIRLEESLKTKTFLQTLNNRLKLINLHNKNIIMLGDRSAIREAKKHVHFRQILRAASNKSLSKLCTHIVERTKLLQIDPRHSVIRYAQRIVLLGRPGCGKHRVGKWLATTLNVCLVSASDLVAKHEQKLDSFGKALSCGSAENVHTSELLTTIVQHRLLQPDCLESGWILVDFPNTAEDVQNFFRMLITPTKALFIDTDESVCRRRKLSRRKHEQINSHMCWQKMLFETKLKFYDFHHQPIIDAFNEQQSCVMMHVDGNRSCSNIQKSIVDKLVI